MKTLKQTCLTLLLTLGMAMSVSPAFAQQNDINQTLAQPAPFDLNNASVEQLTQLPGIGPRKAQAIVDYRNEVGRFLEVEQLTEVKGIGKKMLEKVKSRLFVEE